MLAFVLSTMVAVTYQKTFRGLSYSRNFLQAMILSSIVAAIVMQAIGDSLARGLGMLGALAIVRFRTNFKDPRDIIFMFATLAIGIASGVYAFTIAIVGGVSFCVVALALYISPLSDESSFDGILRFNIESSSKNKSFLDDLMSDYCKKFALITLMDMAQGNRLEYAYHVKLKRQSDKAEFMEQLKQIETVKGVRLLLQDTTVPL